MDKLASFLCLGAITPVNVGTSEWATESGSTTPNSYSQYIQYSRPTRPVPHQQVRSTPRISYPPTMTPHHPLASVPPPLPPGWTEHIGKTVTPFHVHASTSSFFNQVPPARYTFSIHLPENPPMFDPCPHFLLMLPRRRSRSSRHPYQGRTGSE